MRELTEIAQLFYKDVGGVYSGLCSDALSRGDFRALTELSVDPRTYDSADAYLRDAACVGLLRKCHGLPTNVDTMQASVDTWWRAERECYHTNERLNPFVNGDPTCDERLVRFFRQVRKRVIECIGRKPPREVEMVFGPGATMSDKSAQTTICDKLASTPTIYSTSPTFMLPFIRSAWGRDAFKGLNEVLECDRLPETVKGNVFFTVHKDAGTDRGCAKEASINAPLQRGYGIAIKDAMKENKGISLEDLPETHQMLAQAGSIDGSISTIDLRTASDTQCINLIELALPPAWFEPLYALRAAYTFMPRLASDAQKLPHSSGWVKLEKFSSMGNGFTFELETVVFHAIVDAAIDCEFGEHAPRVTSVFGDDIIVDTVYADVVLSALRFCGLTPNGKKTFTTGHFRESCGGDFFRGVAVRPHFLKETLNGTPQDYIALANGLCRVFDQLNGETWQLDPTTIPASWRACLAQLPSSIRNGCRGPAELGDIVIHDRRYDTWSVRSESCVRYLRVLTTQVDATVEFERFFSSVQWRAALYTAGKQPDTPVRVSRVSKDGAISTFLTQRPLEDAVLPYRIEWIPYS